MGSDLEKDFSQVIEQINDKYAQAAKLLAEANKLADSNNLMIAPDYYGYDEDGGAQDVSEQIDYNLVLNELDKAGWSTSSLGC